MNIYLVQITDSIDYDQYDAFVCIAATEDEARAMLPDTFFTNEDRECFGIWVPITSIDTLSIIKVGVAESTEASPRIVLASFNAG
jgi:hypothetical protein